VVEELKQNMEEGSKSEISDDWIEVRRNAQKEVSIATKPEINKKKEKQSRGFLGMLPGLSKSSNYTPAGESTDKSMR
jgi:hypothetical protein